MSTAPLQTQSFHVIASTGRTATTYITQALSSLPDVTALHEGHKWDASEKIPSLPLINLENAQCYKSPEKAVSIVQNKRNAEIIRDAISKLDVKTLIDVAYYYPTLIQALLETHSSLHVVGIIRDCESFVRSAARVTGEDIMAVGWPDPEKPLSPREKFIGMGRIKPRKTDPEFDQWNAWGTIERNIWLWRETNALMLKAKDNFPDRVQLLSFETLKTDPAGFWTTLVGAFNLSVSNADIQELSRFIGDKNRKSSGYQIPPADGWTEDQRDMLKHAKLRIQSMWSR
jgi:hypothetical protein